MSQIMLNITQVMYQTPLVGEVVAGQLSAAEVAQREAQLAEARELRRQAETVSETKAAEPSAAPLPENLKTRQPAPYKPPARKRAKKRREEPLPDENAVVDIRI